MIGITGNFGSGKTTIARMFKKKGAYIIDADSICHSLIQPSKPAYKKILRDFGKAILKKDNSIDRKKLAKIVFEDEKKLKTLNRLLHPYVIKEIDRLIRLNRDKRIIIVDAPLLIESGLHKKMDKIIVVKNRLAVQVSRLKKAMGLTKIEILKRLRWQMPFEKKAGLADFIIDNSHSKNKTFVQVQRIWKQLVR